MNGKEFYDGFKDALDYLGVGFHGMDKTRITLDSDGVGISVENKSCILHILNTTKEKKK